MASSTTTPRTLKERLVENTERFSIVGEKPQGLSRSEIIARAAAFLERNEKSSMAFAFGESCEKGASADGTRHFDPTHEFEKAPDRLPEIARFVEYEMLHREHELIAESDKYRCSYNVLLFGAASKIANRQELSDELVDFLVTHLISPPSTPKAARGRPKGDPQADIRKFQAVEFVAKHGLSPSRNDESDPTSACDLVSGAARQLAQAGRRRFASGYGYDNLKKIYFAQASAQPA